MPTETTAIVSHSPAPWLIQEAPSTKSMRSIRTEAGKAVAFVNRGPAAEANERLLKAAPDMYELLQRIVDATRSRTMSLPAYLTDSAMDMIREIAGS